MSSLAPGGAALLLAAYDAYRDDFAEITRRAPARFATRDWPGGRDDALERLELYRAVLDPAVGRLLALLAGEARQKAVWTAMKQAYAAQTAGRHDAPQAETFFNSASRRVFDTVGVDPHVEFVAARQIMPPEIPYDLCARYAGNLGLQRIVRQLLLDRPFACGYEDLERDARLAGEAAERHLLATYGSAEVDVVEVLWPVFFRNKGAYVVGRIVRGERCTPLLLALVNPEGQVVLDAVLMTSDEASIVFSFTRSYFQVELPDAPGMVAFLKSIMPLKPRAELHIAIGLNKHGKTELYRDFLQHLEASQDSFVIAPGEKGMVMAVFALPSYDVVFKVMRDVFAFPKASTQRDVVEKYRMVFRHGRAGRLVDTQEFEHLSFPRARFEPDLLAMLTSLAGRTVQVEGDRVVFRHLYTERRLMPLNLFLQNASDIAAEAAVIDFGHALRELASTNIFPGDLLLKNFGVTRHGRVVFYDYDEVSFLTDCNFRPLPPGADEAGEATFYVGERDVFPEEFLRFIGFPSHLRDVFLREHGDLLAPTFWIETQERIRSGEILDVFPYPPGRRLRGSG